jgi:flagellar biosynthetic protein FliO
MTDTGSITTLLFAIVALAVVLALAWLLLKGLASLNQRSTSRAPMRIKATLPLGSRERLLIVEYRDTDYFLGVSSGNVSFIDKHATKRDEKNQ